MLKMIFVAAAFAAAGLSAEAATLKAVYTGTMTSGSDATGVFGFAPGTDLTGLAVTATFVYDTALGEHTTGCNGNCNNTRDSILSGTSALVPTHFLNMSVTIDGRTRALPFGTQEQSSIYTYGPNQIGYPFEVVAPDHSGTQYTETSSGYTQSNLFAVLQGEWPRPDPVPTIDTPFTLAAFSGFGNFSFATFFGSRDPVSGNWVGTYGESATGGFNVDGMAISPYVAVAPVPLPAALPLLAVALGGLLALRRRKVA